MKIVPVADVAQRADKAAASRAVVELAFYPAVAVVKKFDQQVEHVHGFAGLWASRGMIAAPDLRVIRYRIIRIAVAPPAYSRASRSCPAANGGVISILRLHARVG
jgi:hypothetical protein